MQALAGTTIHERALAAQKLLMDYRHSRKHKAIGPPDGMLLLSLVVWPPDLDDPDAGRVAVERLYEAAA
jgi:hypothetical protein